MKRFLHEARAKKPSYDELLDPTLDDVELFGIAHAIFRSGVTAADLRAGLQESTSSDDRRVLFLGLAFAPGFTAEDAAFLHEAVEQSPGLFDFQQGSNDSAAEMLSTAHALRLRGLLDGSGVPELLLAQAEQSESVEVPLATAALLDMVFHEIGRSNSVGSKPLEAASLLLRTAKHVADGQSVQLDHQIGARRVLVAARESEAVSEMLSSLGGSDHTPSVGLAFLQHERHIAMLEAVVEGWSAAAKPGGTASAYALGGLLSMGTRESMDAVLRGLSKMRAAALSSLQQKLSWLPPETMVRGFVLVAGDPRIEGNLGRFFEDLQEDSARRLRGIHLSPPQRRSVFDDLDRLVSEYRLRPDSVALALRLMGHVGGPGDIERLRQLGRAYDMVVNAEAAIGLIERRKRIGLE